MIDSQVAGNGKRGNYYRIVHFETDAEKLVNYPVTALEIPATKETPVIQFNAILEKQTNCSLMLESFYKEYIAIRAAGGPYYLNCSLKSQKISHCIFQNALGKLRDDANWKNRSAPIFKVVGTTCLRFAHDEHLFTLHFFLVDHIFSFHKLEKSM